MKPRFHCFFEQSGTFKNQFKKLGYEAFDYDILNDFGETDCIIDLFAEIEKEYDGGGSQLFKEIANEDQILAFYPCIRFEDQIVMGFQGTLLQFAKWNDEQKLEYDIKLHNELHHLYIIITKLAIVCLRKKIPLIIENPYSTQHYLTRYWCLKPKIIDRDRSERGDYFQKPTQYWFINREPSNNLVFEAVARHPLKTIVGNENNKGTNRKVDRSLISKDYAERFIKEFIL